MYEPINVSLASFINCIEAYHKEIKSIQGMAPNALTVLALIPGIGSVWAAGMIAKIGNITVFHSSDALDKYAGLTLRDFESEDTPITKACNAYLRYYFGDTANSVRRHIPEYQDYYVRKYAEIPKHQH